MNPKIKAIFFDMDGVLIEAKEWHYAALNRALDLFGMSISRVDHLTTFDGLPTRKKLEILTLERGLPVELHDFINEMKQYYTIELIHALCRPTFIHERALSFLKAKGYKLAVCSNSVRNTVRLMMDQSGLSPYLDYMLSNEDIKNSKPDPEMYLNAMAHFNLPPEACLIIEDNDHGARAARASGGHLLVVKNTDDTNLDNILKTIQMIEGSSLVEDVLQ